MNQSVSKTCFQFQMNQNDPDKPKAINSRKDAEKAMIQMVVAMGDAPKEKPLVQMIYLKFKTKEIADHFEKGLLMFGEKNHKYFLLNQIVYDNHSPLYRNWICLGCEKRSDINDFCDILGQSFGLDAEALKRSPLILEIPDLG